MERAFSILEALADSDRGLTLGAAAAAARLPKPTAYRVLRTLVTLDYARQDGEGRYHAGPQVLALASSVLSRMDVARRARPALLQLQAVTPEAIHLGMLVGDEAVYVDKLEARRPYRVNSLVGMRLLLHCTSIGKSILAHLPAAERARLLPPASLVARTPQTITDVAGLEAEFERIRLAGYAIDDEENDPGVRCVGAPVFDHNGRVIGAVSVSAPAFNLSRDEAFALAPAVVETSRRVSESLGAPAAAVSSFASPADDHRSSALAVDPA